jgi:hypothetical protein
VFSFDEAHPAIAGQHFLRSDAQEALLAEERRVAELKKRRWVTQVHRCSSLWNLVTRICKLAGTRGWWS